MSRAAPEPRFCRPVAHRRFAEQLPRIESSTCLLRAAVGIAEHELGTVDCGAVENRIKTFADTVLARCRSGSPEAMISHAHTVLFDEEHFRGNTQDYHAPANSYVPHVLETKQGLPITLSLIYKCVMDHVGLPAVGLNLPGHFMAMVKIDDDLMVVDPFHHGRVESRAEVVRRLSSMQGVPLRREQIEAAFRPVTHREWLARMLRNLVNSFGSQGRTRDVGAMRELSVLLGVDA